MILFQTQLLMEAVIHIKKLDQGKIQRRVNQNIANIMYYMQPAFNYTPLTN